jgi:NifU-like protein involved in Fe-S cluster formation/bacterioferritin-associated ferredoxin
MSVIELKPVTHPDVAAKKQAAEMEEWFYTDIVRDHFFSPRNIFRTQKEVEEYKPDGIGMVGSPACILPTTLVRTNPALQSIDRLNVGEHVLSHDGGFHAITRLFRPQHRGTLVKLKNQLGELTATKDHLVFALQVPQTSSFVHTSYKKRIPKSWVHAGDLKKGDIVLFPIPREIRDTSTLKIHNAKRKKYDFDSRMLPENLPVSEELLTLFGYFVAEGHTKENKDVGFTFGLHEEDYAQDVVELVKEVFGLPASVRRRPQNTRIDVTVHSSYLARLFRFLFGKSAQQKRVPEFVLFLDPELQKGFIRGVWRGDGYFSAARSQPRAGFATISRELLQQLTWMLLRQRIVPSVYEEKESVKNNVRHQHTYRIHVGDVRSLERLAAILRIPFKRDSNKRHNVESWFDEQYLYMPLRSVEEVDFDGRLRNLEIAGSHTYATDAFLVHNCGDMMKMWVQVDKAQDKIIDCKWQTFGCGSAIASTSMLSVMLTENGGMKIDDALKLRPQDIVKRLKDLPARKFHCSVLGDKALRAAINDYFRKSGQEARVVVEGAKVIDKILKITDKDIEEAVLEGALTFEDVQKKTKVGIHDKSCIPEVEQLIRFYREKFFGGNK